ncbi:MAG TPA: molybdopterin cofactor-binding domain-containing protein [Marinagarivorans sp.]
MWPLHKGDILLGNEAVDHHKRRFIKTLANGSAVGLTVTSLPAVLAGQSAEQESLLSAGYQPAWAPEPGKAAYRIDGLPKVLGQKIYARDFRARDFPSWPDKEYIVHPLRCDRVDSQVVSYNYDCLPANLQPVAVVDAERLKADNMSLGGGMSKPFFTQLNTIPEYYGQPVALLIFSDFDIYRKALKILQFNKTCIEYAFVSTSQPVSDYAPNTHLVRDASQHFSQVASPDYATRYSAIANTIRSEIANNKNWRIFERSFRTQVMDPMFMEPEAGLAWYDANNKKLHLLLGTQSPTGDIEGAAEIFSAPDCAFPLASDDSVELISCYPGGGFGGRDKSYFTMYLAMAAPYANGAVLRWSHTRFEQFQVGLKRHKTDFWERLAFDRSGVIQALDCDFTMNGGGRKNLSPYVAQLAALSSFCAYDIPKAVATAKATNTRDILGGSQRGFGGPQAFLAIETLLDEAAAHFKQSPFELRRKNLLTPSSHTITGAPITQDLQLTDILDQLESHSLWQARRKRQREYRRKGLRYGVGLALSNEAYGTSGDGMFGGVQLNRDGTITVRTPYIDMGNGAATALGLAPATFLGLNASAIKMGDAGYFDALGLTSSSGDAGKSNYVLKGSGSASACLGAFYQYHVVEQAGLALLLTSVVPAVAQLLGREVLHTDLQWQDGYCIVGNQAPIDWRDIVDVIFARQLPTYNAVHASFVGQFAMGKFQFPSLGGDSPPLTLPLDYIAAGTDAKNLQSIRRLAVTNPPPQTANYGRSTYAPCGALVAVTVNPKSGEINVRDCVSVLSAGKQHCTALISGQSQGGVAMAIGYTLLENCPVSADGPGNGLWNLNRYHLAKMADVPKRQTLMILPPGKGETTARGIAEAVMCPIPPAILNALAMATRGHRFTELPVKNNHILEALA